MIIDNFYLLQNYVEIFSFLKSTFLMIQNVLTKIYFLQIFYEIHVMSRESKHFKGTKYLHSAQNSHISILSVAIHCFIRKTISRLQLNKGKSFSKQSIFIAISKLTFSALKASIVKKLSKALGSFLKKKQIFFFKSMANSYENHLSNSGDYYVSLT